MSFFRRTQSLINEKQYLACIKDVVESTAELYALYRKFDERVLQGDLLSAGLDILEAAKLLVKICESVDYELDLPGNKLVLLSSLLSKIKRSFPRVQTQLVSEGWIKVLKESSSCSSDTDFVECDTDIYTHVYESVSADHLKGRDTQLAREKCLVFPITEEWYKRLHLLADVLFIIALHWLNFDKPRLNDTFLVKVDSCSSLDFGDYIKLLFQLDLLDYYWELFDFVATDYYKPRYIIPKVTEDDFKKLVLERIVECKPYNINVIYSDVADCSELVSKILYKINKINEYALQVLGFINAIPSDKYCGYIRISKDDADALVQKYTLNLYRDICAVCYIEKTIIESFPIVECFWKNLANVNLPYRGEYSEWACEYIKTSMERLRHDILAHVEYLANKQHIIDIADYLQVVEIQNGLFKTTNAYCVINAGVFEKLLYRFIVATNVRVEQLPKYERINDIGHITISYYCYLVSIYIIFACTYPCVTYKSFQDAGKEVIDRLLSCCNNLACQVATQYVVSTLCVFQDFISKTNELGCIQVTNRESVDAHIHVITTFNLFISNCYYIARILSLGSLAAVDCFHLVSQHDIQKNPEMANLKVVDHFHFTQFQSTLEIMGNRFATHLGMYNKQCLDRILIEECSGLLMLQDGDQHSQQKQFGEYTSAWIYKIQGEYKRHLPAVLYRFNMSVFVDLCYTSIPEVLLDCFEQVNFAPNHTTVEATLSFLDKMTAALLEASVDLDHISMTSKAVYYHLFKNIFLLDNTVIEQGNMHFTQRNLNRMARLLRYLETMQT